MNRKPVVDPDEAFKHLQDIVFRLATQFSEKYPIEYKEAEREAYFVFVRSCYDYDPSRGAKHSTWCYQSIWWHLKDIVTARTKDPHVCETDLTKEEFSYDALFAVDEKVPALECVEDLSNEAKELLYLLLETPGEILAEVRTPFRLLCAVKRYMVALGRSKQAVERAHQEVQNRLKAEWASN